MARMWGVAAAAVVCAALWPTLGRWALVVVPFPLIAAVVYRPRPEPVERPVPALDWPALAADTPLADTDGDYRGGPDGRWSLGLSWAPGAHLLGEVCGHTALIESLMEAPPGSVTVEAAGPNAAAVVCHPTGAMAGLPWSGHTAVSITEPVEQCRYTDGTPEVYARYSRDAGGRHKLRAGMSGAGKSRAARHDLCSYGPAEDVVVWLIDQKGGASFRPFAPLADWFATTPEESLDMLAALVRLCDVRGEFMAEQGWEVWQPSRELPVVWLLVDETARLTGMQARPDIGSRAVSAAVDIAQLGRAVGVIFDPMTQFGSIEALGSLQLRENMHVTECYRMRSEGAADAFLPGAPAGIDPAHLPASRKGLFYADVEGEFRPLPGLKHDVTDEQMHAVVARFWDSTPQIEAWHADLLGSAYESRDRWVPNPDGTVTRIAGGERDDAPEVPDEEEGSMGQDQGGWTVPTWDGVEQGPTYAEMTTGQTPAEAVVVDAEQAPLAVLRALRDGPVHPRTLCETSGIPEAAVHDLLCDWETQGRVRHVGWGEFALVSP